MEESGSVSFQGESVQAAKDQLDAAVDMPATLSPSSSKSSIASQTSGHQHSQVDREEDDEEEKPFTQKFVVFVQYIDSKGAFIIDAKSLVDGRSYSVQRYYEDFQALHDLLETLSKRAAIIPPLPQAFKPEEKHIPFEIFRTLSDCKIQPTNAAEFAHYLDAIVGHPALGAIAQVEEFLTRARFVRPEIDLRRCGGGGGKRQQSSIMKLVSSKFKGPSNPNNHRDCDDFYEKQRGFVVSFEERLLTTKGHFESMLLGNDKLCNVISHLATCIISTLVINSSSSETLLFNKTFCLALERYKAHIETYGVLADESLRATFDYLFEYNLAFREMLSRRTELMDNYESANKNLQRQMDTKHFEKASQEKKQAERLFEQFNDTGRQEIERFHKYRGEQLVRSINRYVEYQLTVSKHTALLLKSCISTLKSE